VVDHLPRQHEALSSKPSISNNKTTTKKRKTLKQGETIWVLAFYELTVESCYYCMDPDSHTSERFAQKSHTLRDDIAQKSPSLLIYGHSACVLKLCLKTSFPTPFRVSSQGENSQRGWAGTQETAFLGLLWHSQLHEWREKPQCLGLQSQATQCVCKKTRF
jgi:hypothetical protein